MHFTAVLEHSPQPGLLKVDLSLHYPEEMLYFDADMRFGGLHQIIQAPLRCVSQQSVSGRMASRKPMPLPCISSRFSIPWVARIRKDHGLLAVQEIRGWGQIMHVGSRSPTEWMRPLTLSTPMLNYRFASLRLHPQVLLVPLLGLMHLRIPLSCLVFG